MNGMQYMRPKFTLPASSKTGQLKWDAAFLTKTEFLAKYPDWTEENYDTVILESPADTLTRYEQEGRKPYEANS